MEYNSIRQIRFTSGHEIICKVNYDEFMAFLCDRKKFVSCVDALSMFACDEEVDDELVTRYAFKPPMALQTDIKAPITFSSFAVEQYFTPSADVIEKYKEILSTAEEDRAEAAKQEAKEKRKASFKVIQMPTPDDTSKDR